MLPPESWMPLLSDLPQSLPGEVLLAGEDFSRLREWVEGLPVSRAASEPALYPLQDISLVQGGRVGIVRGSGVGELGSAAVDEDGNRIDWSVEVGVVLDWARAQQSWADIELSELMPRGSQRLFGEEEIGDVTYQARIDLIPRSIWRPRRLTRTTRVRCAGCLCVDLESRSVEEERLRT